MPSAGQMIIAAAGSGKTTYIVTKALASPSKKTLITTYTQANRDEIVNKIVQENGVVPSNIEVKTWFSFLLQHCVKPYQGAITTSRIRGLLFVNAMSAIGIAEKDAERYYFYDGKIYSDKLSKFAVRCDDATGGSVMDRLSRVYDSIYIDEVQDLCGYDLELLSKLLDCSSEVILVGDPRQATYTTHPDNMNKQYKKGGVVDFINQKCGQKCVVDYVTLNVSHRNHASICAFASPIFPEYSVTEPCLCTSCRQDVAQHSGVFLVSADKADAYIREYDPVILRYSKAEYPEWNFGQAKGKTFEHTLIYPTADFVGYLIDGVLTKQARKKGKSATQDRFDRSKLYVASTRARYSLGVVCPAGALGRLTKDRLSELSARIY